MFVSLFCFFFNFSMFFHTEPNAQGNFMAVFGFDYRCETASLQAMKLRTRSIPSNNKKKKTEKKVALFFLQVSCM